MQSPRSNHDHRSIPSRANGAFRTRRRTRGPISPSGPRRTPGWRRRTDRTLSTQYIPRSGPARWRPNISICWPIGPGNTARC